jgi:hypothetical protein
MVSARIVLRYERSGEGATAGLARSDGRDPVSSLTATKKLPAVADRDQSLSAQLASRNHPRSSWTSRAVTTSACLTPVFRSDGIQSRVARHRLRDGRDNVGLQSSQGSSRSTLSASAVTKSEAVVAQRT